MEAVQTHFTYHAETSTWVGELSQVAPAGFIPVEVTVTDCGAPVTFVKAATYRDGEGDLVSILYLSPEGLRLRLFND